MNYFASGLRYAWRQLQRAPGFSLLTITMLALGIGLSIAMFSVVRGILLGSLPFPQAERLVVVESSNPEQSVHSSNLTAAEAVQLDADAVFAEFGYYVWGGLTVYDDAHPREFSIVIVSEGYFPSFAVQPQLGRWFEAADFTGESDAIVISHDEWQRLLGGDPQVIGRRIDTSDGPMRVIGVMPDGFDSAISDGLGAWRPWPVQRLTRDRPWYWNARFVNAVARLPAEAGALDQRLAATLEAVQRDFSLPAEGWRLRSTPMLQAIVGDLDGVLWGAFALSLLVLLIGCANVAILLDARQVASRHQHAVVQALGASRTRLYRCLLIEVGLLGGFAVLAGLVLALLGIDAVRELARGSLPRVDAIAVDRHSVLLALSLGLLLPFLTAVAGTLRLRGAAADAMRSGGRGLLGSERPRRALPALGIALSTISLIAASALLLSLWRLQQVEMGYRLDQVQAMLLYREGDPDQWRQFATSVQERLAALPGVKDVALSSHAPLGPHGSFKIDLQREGRNEPEPYQADLRRVSAEYLSLLDIPLLAGRGIEAGDSASGPKVALISRSLAQRSFADRSPLDQTIGLPLGQGERVPYRVVGVFEDIRNAGPRSEPQPEVLIAYAQSPSAGMTFMVRSERDLPGLDAQMREALWQVDPREALSAQFHLREPLDERLQPTRFFVRVVGAFAVAALLLAGIGIYAVSSFQQQRRIGEFGLRLAIGAQPVMLSWQILREALRTAGLGIAVGVLGGWVVLQLIRAQLFGLDGGGLGVMLIGIGVLLLAALLAALLPARRAGRIDPMQALRQD